MRVYVKLLIIFETLSYCESYTSSPNVGSVLFSPSDLDKKQWTRSELGALQARRYFQHLIPPPHLTYALNDEYLINLLNYFENCYSTIDKEANSSVEQEVMDMALSDAIGGYIKVWVLPITKYAYYGGTVSCDNAIKVFQLYGNIKRNLNTDGRSWRGPDEDLLKSVTINIAQKPHGWYPRSTHDACDRLAYYEKTDKGLIIPLPYINWGLTPQTMFIPLKNQSLIQLMSPNSSTALLDYYNIAACCLNTENLDSYDDFGSRFQVWLTSDVVPHLKDDNLYIAFGSVLALLNKTKNFYRDIVNFCDDKYLSLQNKALAAGCPISWTSKKVLFIVVLLFLEIIWCIPALCCIWSHKKKSKTGNLQKFLQYFKRKPKYNSRNPFSHKDDKNHKNLFPGVKLFLKPRTRNLEVDVEFPSYGPKYVTVRNLKSSKEEVTHVNEISKRCSLENMPKYKNASPSLEGNLNISNQQHTCKSPPIRSILKESKCSKSVPLITDLNSTKTLTLFQEHEIKNISYTHASISMSKSVCKCISLNTGDDKKTSTQDAILTNRNENPAVTDNKRKDVATSVVNQKTKENSDKRSNNCFTRSEIKTKSRSIKMKESRLKKISEIKHEPKNDTNVHPKPNIKKYEPQTITKKSKAVEIAKSNKCKGYAKKEQRSKSKVAKILNPTKTINLKEKEESKNDNPTTYCNQTGDNQILIRKKSRVPKIFRPKNDDKTDEKQKSNDYPTLNIKIYNTQTDIVKRSDITKISNPSRENSQEQLHKDNHTLNIDIDNSKTDIEVDLTSYRSSKVKPSKIPRRIIFKADNLEQTGITSNKKALRGTVKTLSKTIKTTLDDCAIQKASKKNDKLNTTL